MTRLFNDSFEIPITGYQEPWTETIGAGNSINPAFSIPGTPPPGAGSQSFNSILSSANANAYAEWDNGSNETVSYIRGYFYLISAGATTTGITDFLTLRAAAGVDLLTYRFRWTGSLGFHLWASSYDGGSFVAFSNFQINVGQWYRLEAKYDSVNNLYEFRIDGVTIDSGALASPRVDARRFRIGAQDARSDGLSLVIDLAGWDNVTWLGEEPAGGGLVIPAAMQHYRNQGMV